MTTYPALTLLALACFATIGCQTTAPQTKTPDRFHQADANHDGKLSRDEINTYLVTGIFESRDTNHDGRLAKTEWLVGEDVGQEKAFRDRDANHDGAVSREEMTAYYGSKEGSPH